MPTLLEQEAITSFLERYFEPELPTAHIANAEASLVADLVTEVTRRAQGTRYLLGSAIDYLLMAQKLSKADVAAQGFRPDITEAMLFAQYTLVTERAGRTANTLTLRFGIVAETGMRGFEEKVVEWFRTLGRQYPSAYVYNTGQWQKSKDLLVTCFKLSTYGRRSAVEQLLRVGLSLFPVSQRTGRATARTLLFPQLLAHYPRTAAGENGGLTLQALAYGFFYTDRQHLELAVDKVRTGSSRQGRVGDVDGYYGLDLALTVEVKDMVLTASNYQKQLAVFLDKVRQTPDTAAIVVAAGIEEAPHQELLAAGVSVLTVDDLSQMVAVWDWPKQDRAVHAVLHYLAHIEQNPAAVSRLLSFVQQHDAVHDSLTGQPTIAAE